MPYAAKYGFTLVTYGQTMTVDRDSPTPPYRQIAAELRGQIESGQLAPGAVLPSVTTIVQEYGVAKLTAQKALRVLRDEGLAVVVPGWGTFVRQ